MPAANCAACGEVCTYSTEHDARKPASKQFVDALQQRIRTLEALLEENNIVPGVGSTAGVQAMDIVGVKPEASSGEGGAREQLSLGVAMDRLKLDDERELLQHGPTSPMWHIPKLEKQNDVEPSSSYHSIQTLSSSPLSNSQNPTLYGFDHVHLGRSAEPEDVKPVINEEEGEEIEWDRYLPEIPGMDRALHDNIVDLYFSYFNSWCCWASPKLFKRDMQICLAPNSTTIRTSFYSPLLHNTILSLGLNYSDDPRVRKFDAASRLTAVARDFVDDELERPRLSTISGLMNLGSCYSTIGYHGRGWAYAGMAMRMLNTLGLNIDCSAWVKKGFVSQELKYERDRTAFLLYIQDKFWSCYVGRFVTVWARNFTMELPDINDAEDKELWEPVVPILGGGEEDGAEWSMSPSSDGTGVSSETGGTTGTRGGDGGPKFFNSGPGVPSWTSTTFLWTCKLAMLMERVMDGIYGLGADIQSSKVQLLVSSIDVDLEKWNSDLPPPLQVTPYTVRPPPPHVIMLSMMHWFISILLYRPFLNRVEGKPPHPLYEIACKRCEKAASKSVALLQLYDKSPGIRYAPISMIQMSFTAGTIHLLTAITAASSKAPKRVADALAGARTCVDALFELGKTWQSSVLNAKILDQLVREWTAKFEAEENKKKSYPASSQPVDRSTMDSTDEVVAPKDERVATGVPSNLAAQLAEMTWPDSMPPPIRGLSREPPNHIPPAYPSALSLLHHPSPTDNQLVQEQYNPAAPSIAPALLQQAFAFGSAGQPLYSQQPHQPGAEPYSPFAPMLPNLFPPYTLNANNLPSLTNAPPSYPIPAAAQLAPEPPSTSFASDPMAALFAGQMDYDWLSMPIAGQESPAGMEDGGMTGYQY
ncbi:hypothetical protein MNV49_003452 [Pseudohyphozyma bogoriensis]|nr:hypothetical protein MNV49_003452 [Pseudohyphozyma bogoriensis]